MNREEMSPLNTSGSSIDEIFNTALSNLDFLSDDDNENEVELTMEKKTSFSVN